MWGKCGEPCQSQVVKLLKSCYTARPKPPTRQNIRPRIAAHEVGSTTGCLRSAGLRKILAGGVAVLLSGHGNLAEIRPVQRVELRPLSLLRMQCCTFRPFFGACGQCGTGVPGAGFSCICDGIWDSGPTAFATQAPGRTQASADRSTAEPDNSTIEAWGTFKKGLGARGVSGCASTELCSKTSSLPGGFS